MSAYALPGLLSPTTKSSSFSFDSSENSLTFSNSGGSCFDSTSWSSLSSSTDEKKFEIEETSSDVEVSVLDARLDMQVLISSASSSSSSSSSKPVARPRKNMKRCHPRRRAQEQCAKSAEEDESSTSISEKAILFELSVYAHGENSKVTRSLTDIRALLCQMENEMSYRELDPQFRDSPAVAFPELPPFLDAGASADQQCGGGFMAMRRMMLNYAPKLNGWFRAVLKLVNTDESPCLMRFLTEPKWDYLQYEKGFESISASSTKQDHLECIEECEDDDGEEEEEDEEEN